MYVSVIIPYRDRIDALRNTLAALSSQMTGHEFEIIVVDDGSRHPPQALLDTKVVNGRVRFISQKNAGISKARNSGLIASSGEVVVFLDCDMVVAEDFVERHALAFVRENEPLLQVGPRRLLSITPKDLSRDAIFSLDSTEDDRSNFFERFSCDLSDLEIGYHLCFGHNMSMRRADCLALSGFDENFTGWGFEDCEFAYRMKNAGARLLFNPSVSCMHQYHEFKWPIEKSRYHGWRRNLDYFSTKHDSFDVKVQYVLDHYFNPDNAIRDNLWTNLLTKMEIMLRVMSGRLCY